MEDDQCLPMMGVRRPPRQPKLKDTCDMCSTSKVRCDKTKPVCGRCERLGYNCFYSPARRMGKRRCIRCPSSPSNPTELEEKPPKVGPTTTAVTTKTAREESVATDSNASDDGAESSFRQHFMNAHSPRQQTTKLGAAIHSADERINENSKTSSSSRTSTMEAMLLGFGSSIPRHVDSDCVAVAVDILQHLDATRGMDPAYPPAGSRVPAAKLEASIGSTSQAIKRVSTILICPCSKRTDVGLLAAAVCAALLDTYEIILRESTRPRLVAYPSSSSIFSSSSSFSSSSASPYTSNPGTRKRTSMGVIREAGRSDELDEKATLMRILDELPMVASFVTQFTKRYRHEGEKFSRDLLQGLAASMTARLRVMIDEVTNSVAQV